MNYFSCLDATVLEVEPGVKCYSKRAGLRLTVHRRTPSIKNLFSEKSSSNSKFAVNGTFSNAGKKQKLARQTESGKNVHLRRDLI